MPWQQYVADVVLEIDSASGLLVYDELGLTVPRQSGKSTFVLAKSVHRASATGFFGPRQRLVYTAQTRNKAREKWEEDYVADLASSRAFAGKVTPHFGNGNEHLRFPNGSRFGIEANTDKAGHGGTLDEAYIDEAFAQIDGRLEQAFEPAMITRKNKLLAWISTAGWVDGSPYLQAKVRAGREQALAGSRSGLAYFEWSAPEDADPEDEDAWPGYMPALGHTISVEAIRNVLVKAMRDNKLNDFRRAYMNQWVPKSSGEAPVIPDEVWRSGRVDLRSRPADPVSFAVHVSRDRSWSAIALAGRLPDGRRQVEVVEYLPGTAWLVDRMDGLNRKWQPATVVVDARGAATSLLADLEKRGVVVRRVNAQERAQAFGAFFDAAVQGGLAHLAQPELDAALQGATTRHVGEGLDWASRDGGDITALKAATFALFAHDNSSTDVWGFFD